MLLTPTLMSPMHRTSQKRCIIENEVSKIPLFLLAIYISTILYFYRQFFIVYTDIVMLCSRGL